MKEKEIKLKKGTTVLVYFGGYRLDSNFWR